MPTSFRNTKKVSLPTRRVHWAVKRAEEEEERRVREAKQLAISEANLDSEESNLSHDGEAGSAV